MRGDRVRGNLDLVLVGLDGQGQGQGGARAGALYVDKGPSDALVAAGDDVGVGDRASC